MKTINSRGVRERKQIERIKREISEAFRNILKRKIDEILKDAQDGKFQDPSLPKRKQ
jgi:hypothetical protein